MYAPTSEKGLQDSAKPGAPEVKMDKTILLVDDEEAIREVGEELLKDMGYAVLLARDGEEAVEVYERRRDDVDMVILDIVMPKMDGGEAFDKIRAINPRVKVLVWSGSCVHDFASKMLQRGCYDFIQKPFSYKDLSGKIRNILNAG